MTKEESLLWYEFLRTYPIKFVRQKILGRYIVDFYCAKIKLAIEIDGLHHTEEEKVLKDTQRTIYLKNFGVTVIRLANIQVTDCFDWVCDYIDKTVKTLI